MVVNLNFYCVVCQFFRFLETDRYNWYGLGAALDLLNGTTWEQSGMFPRVSLCDFDVGVFEISIHYVITAIGSMHLSQ